MRSARSWARKSAQAVKNDLMQDGEIIGRIRSKIQELVRRIEALRKENGRLQTALEQAREKEASLRDEVERLEQKLIARSVGASGWNEQEKTELDKRLQSYLKEIDRCITLLGEDQ